MVLAMSTILLLGVCLFWNNGTMISTTLLLVVCLFWNNGAIYAYPKSKDNILGSSY